MKFRVYDREDEYVDFDAEYADVNDTQYIFYNGDDVVAAFPKDQVFGFHAVKEGE